MESQPAPRTSAIERLARSVYDAQAGSRSPLLDGPWWLMLALVAALSVLVVADGAWKWLALSVLVVLFWLPFGIRWVVAIRRSVSAFRGR